MNTADQHVQRVIDELRRLPGVAAVYLFGSHAKGRPRPYSDIDLCVVTEPGISPHAKEAILAYASRRIDLHLLSDLPLFLQFRVFQEGMPLTVTSPALVMRMQSEVIRRYQDFRPRLERYYARLLA